MRPLKPGDFASMVGPSSNGEPISAEEAEKISLEKLKKYEQELERTISDLAFLYGDRGRADMGIQYLDRLVSSPESGRWIYHLQANCCPQFPGEEHRNPKQISPSDLETESFGTNSIIVPWKHNFSGQLWTFLVH